MCPASLTLSSLPWTLLLLHSTLHYALDPPLNCSKPVSQLPSPSPASTVSTQYYYVCFVPSRANMSPMKTGIILFPCVSPEQVTICPVSSSTMMKHELDSSGWRVFISLYLPWLSWGPENSELLCPNSQKATDLYLPSPCGSSFSSTSKPSYRASKCNPG